MFVAPYILAQRRDLHRRQKYPLRKLAAAAPTSNERFRIDRDRNLGAESARYRLELPPITPLPLPLLPLDEFCFV